VLKVFKNRVLRRIFAPKSGEPIRDGEIDEWGD
jgi:hypothetical protein